MPNAFKTDEDWIYWLTTVERRWGRMIVHFEMIDDLYEAYMRDEPAGQACRALYAKYARLQPVAVPEGLDDDAFDPGDEEMPLARLLWASGAFFLVLYAAAAAITWAVRGGR